METKLTNERLRTAIGGLLFVGSVVLAFFVPGAARLSCLVIAALILLGQGSYKALNAAIGAVRRGVDLLEQQLREALSAFDQRCGMMETRLKELAAEVRKLSEITPAELVTAVSPSGGRLWPWVMVLVFFVMASNGVILLVMHKKIAVLNSELRTTGTKLAQAETSLETALREAEDARKVAQRLSARLEGELAALNLAWCGRENSFESGACSSVANATLPTANAHLSLALQGNDRPSLAANSLWLMQYAD